MPVASEESENVDNLSRALPLCSSAKDGKITEDRVETADAKSSEKQLPCDEAEPERLVTQIVPDIYEFDSASSFLALADLPVYIPDTTWKEDQSRGGKGEGARDSTTSPSKMHSRRGGPAEQGEEEEKDKAEAVDCGGEAMDVAASYQVQVDTRDIDRRSNGETVVGVSRMGQEGALASTTSSPSKQNQSVVQAVSSSQNDKVESKSQSRSQRPRPLHDLQVDGTDSDFLHASDSQEDQESSMKVLRLDSLSPSPPPSSLLTSQTGGGQPQPQLDVLPAAEESVFDDNKGDDCELRERGKVDESYETPSFFGDAREFEQILLSTHWAKIGGQSSHEDGDESEEVIQEPVTNTLEVDVVGMESEEEVTKPSCNAEVTGAPSTKEMVGHTYQRGTKCVSPPRVENRTDGRRYSVRSQHVRSSNRSEDVGKSVICH